MTTCIEIRGLSKTYKNNKQLIEALKPIDLDVHQGEIFGLLGPNGAGKTTMIKLMLGIIAPTSGSCHILGQDISSLKAKELIGYLPENHRFPLYLNGQQMLEFYGNLGGMSGKTLQKRIDEVLEFVNMTEWRKLKIQRYSKGMMQRIGLAQALLNHPHLLFLDEPTDGIDPVGRMEIREILEVLKSEGTTIFVNSHLLSEVELITDRVAILRKGVVVKSGNTHELTQSRDQYIITLAGGTPPASLPGMTTYNAETREIELTAASPEALNAALDVLRQSNCLLATLSPKKSTLEEIFIALMSEKQEYLAPAK
ncbi:MAG: ABC transporter ATP-binding protein [Candidatus Kapabacteria bacterium]|nr:ABC transporter ATP-binding protein [Candidatus Kapabacteria bacterium]